MYRITLVLLPIAFPHLVLAVIPEFENTGIQSLKMESLVHITSSKTGSKANWEIKILDFVNDRLYRAEYEDAEEPLPDEQPIELEVSSPELTTLISHSNKKVIYSKGGGIRSLDFLTPNGLTLLRGVSAADIIKHAQSVNILEASGETHVFEIGEPFWKPPFYTNPVHFTLDNNYRVIEIVNQQEKSYTRSFYQWERLGDTEINYLKRFGGTAKDAFGETNSERVVEKIEINPELSSDLFQLDVPSDYKVIDNRKLLQPLSIPGLGGGAGGAGSSQKP